MSYDNTIDFKDHIVQYPNRFKQTIVAPGVVELVPTWIGNSDEVIEPGTPVDSELFKKLKQNVTIYQQTLIAVEGQTVINLARSYLVGQNRISLSIGGVKQYSGQDYIETNATRLTMNTPLKGGYKIEVIMFTASQALAEDFFEETMAAVEATQAAKEAAEEAHDAADLALAGALNWRNPVDTFSQLMSVLSPQNRDTIMTRDTGKVYRYNGDYWNEVQDINPTVINEVDSRLSEKLTTIEVQKADKSYVQQVTQSIASGSPKGIYSTVSALTAAFPSGNTNLYVVTADGKWYFWSGTAWTAGGTYQSTTIADKSISTIKTDFIELGTNLFDKSDSDIIDGSYYNYQGSITANPSYFITGKIFVKPNDVFIMPYGEAAFQDGLWGTFFDQSGIRIANVATTVSGSYRIITVPNNGSIAYMRVNGILNQKSTLMIVAGTTYPAEYISFSRVLKDDKNSKELSKTKIRLDLIEGQFANSANLFDKSNAGNESGYFFNYQGVKTVLASSFISHMIPAVAGDTITIKHYNTFGSNPMAVYYDGVGNSLSYLKGTLSVDNKSATFITPSNASVRQVRFNGQLADINGFMIVKGGILPDYYIAKEKMLSEEFGLNTRQRSYLPQNKLSRKVAVFDGDSICNAINDAQDGWAGRISVKNEMPYVNYAVDGGTITAGTMAGSNPRHWVSRSVSGYRADAEYIIFEGGTNDADLLGVNNLGVISTGFSATLDDTTFSGAVESTLKQAILKYPGKKIGFIIAHKMGNTAQQQIRKVFFDRIIEICKKWGVPYINLWETTHINPELETLRTVYYSDWQHLTSVGYDYLTPLIEDWMRTL